MAPVNFFFLVAAAAVDGFFLPATFVFSLTSATTCSAVKVASFFFLLVPVPDFFVDAMRRKKN